MHNRSSTVGILAIILWGSTALVTTLRAQQDIRQDGAALTDESLQKTLDGLGYEPKKLGNGYLISLKKDTWTYNMQFVLSKDLSRLGMNANLGVVEKPDEITAPKWMNLLVANGNIDPSFFFFDKDTKKLYIHRVLDNRAITPSYIRQQVDNFCANIKDTADSWNFTK